MLEIRAPRKQHIICLSVRTAKQNVLDNGVGQSVYVGAVDWVVGRAVVEVEVGHRGGILECVLQRNERLRNTSCSPANHHVREDAGVQLIGVCLPNKLQRVCIGKVQLERLLHAVENYRRGPK